LLRVPAGSSDIEEVKLPFEGHIGEAFTDPRIPGVTVYLSSWVMPPAEYAYDPQIKAFTDLHIGTRGDIDSAVPASVRRSVAVDPAVDSD